MPAEKEKEDIKHMNKIYSMNVFLAWLVIDFPTVANCERHVFVFEDLRVCVDKRVSLT